MNSLVLCTCPDQQSAQALAYSVVHNKLAACVNILPAITSIYRWQDKIEQTSEVLLHIKTSTHCLTELCQLLKQQHPYDVPEIIALDITSGDNDYLNWINEMVK